MKLAELPVYVVRAPRLRERRELDRRIPSQTRCSDSTLVSQGSETGVYPSAMR